MLNYKATPETHIIKKKKKFNIYSILLYLSNFSINSFTNTFNVTLV